MMETSRGMSYLHKDTIKEESNMTLTIVGARDVADM